MGIEFLPQHILDKYEVHEWRHACAVIKNDFPREWDDIIEVLSTLTLTKSDIINPGGGLSSFSQRFNRAFYGREWKETSFDTKIMVGSNIMKSPTHKVDCVKGRIALELEWSNKDPFFDRDLNNFRLLFELRAISAGIIVTKSNDLSVLFKSISKQTWEKYGWSTTWMSKLLPRIEGGGGGGCPILVFGITSRLCED